MKAMEDVGVRYDGTVRNSINDVLQFVYGEDGMDGAAVEHQNIDLVTLSRDELERRCLWRVDDERFGDGMLTRDVVEEIRLNADTRAALAAEFDQLVDDHQTIHWIFPDGEDRWPLPVNLQRLIWNAKKVFSVGAQDDDADLDADALHPVDAIEGVRDLCKRLVVVPGDDPLSIEAQTNATLLFCILLRSTLASRRVICEHKMSRAAFEWLLGEIESRFAQAMVAPGEMVGAIAAQSVGEPATQMTLNSAFLAKSRCWMAAQLSHSRARVCSVSLCGRVGQERDARRAAPQGDYQCVEEHQGAVADRVFERAALRRRRGGQGGADQARARHARLGRGAHRNFLRSRSVQHGGGGGCRVCARLLYDARRRAPNRGVLAVAFAH